MNQNIKNTVDGPDEVLDALHGIASADISDAMHSLSMPDSALDPTIRLLVGESLLGRAVTIGRIPTPRNSSQNDLDPTMGLAIQQVIDSASPRSILVTAAQGIATHANWGGNQALRAKMVAIGGLVTDGAVRDLAEMAEYGVTIFAKGTSPRAGDHFFSTVSKNSPVICGGVLIRPGDIIVGDADGLIVVRPADVAQIVERVKALKDREKQMRSHMRLGGTLEAAVSKYKT